MAEFEDKLLIKAFLLTRSEMIFKQIYRKHTLSIFKMALQLTNKNMLTAEEIVQETWLRAISNLKTFQWHSSFKTWLTGIAINCSREYDRKIKMNFIPGNEEEVSMLNCEMKLDINNALALLPPGYREILILHDMEGFKHNEIGHLLHITEGTSKSQLFHARKALQKLLN